jgi:hypothetical protein
MRQRDYFLQQTSAGEHISNTLRAGYKYGETAAAFLQPGNLQKELKKAAKKFRSMTWAQLVKELLKLGWFVTCIFQLGHLRTTIMEWPR